MDNNNNNLAATTSPITPTQKTNTSILINTAKSSPDEQQDHQTELNPSPISNAKPISFTNGLLKRHHHHYHHHHQTPLHFTYKECLKNHAANMGHHALDGCGEFMPSPKANPSEPSSLKCAACGCHRNFHRKEPEDVVISPVTPNTTTTIEYQSHHRHHPPPPVNAPPGNRSPSSSSPPPISSTYYPSSGPHMLLALSGNLQGPQSDPHHGNGIGNMSISPSSGLMGLSPNPISPSGRKRFRTKFNQDQKDKMFEFAERVGWKMQKRDEEIVHEFCNEVGIDRSVLKVWMHNNKNTFGKKDTISTTTTTSIINNNNNKENNNNHNGKITTTTTTTSLDHHHHHHHHQFDHHANGNGNGNGNVTITNGGSSSSS
ncbi:hypothetical protein ACFE04_010958 [Oxalis oulophora]